jgi:hypothetical protein
MRPKYGPRAAPRSALPAGSSRFCRTPSVGLEPTTPYHGNRSSTAANARPHSRIPATAAASVGGADRAPEGLTRRAVVAARDDDPDTRMRCSTKARLCPTACPTGCVFPVAKPNRAGIIIRVSGVGVPPPALPRPLISTANQALSAAGQAGGARCRPVRIRCSFPGGGRPSAAGCLRLRSMV